MQVRLIYQMTLAAGDDGFLVALCNKLNASRRRLLQHHSPAPPSTTNINNQTSHYDIPKQEEHRNRSWQAHQDQFQTQATITSSPNSSSETRYIHTNRQARTAIKEARKER